MVQLREEYYLNNIPFNFGFNSNMVQLRVHQHKCAISHFCSFNSNMVQLRELTNSDKSFLVDKFQFQYGSIKRDFSFSVYQSGMLFQFQYGSIKRINSQSVSTPT